MKKSHFTVALALSCLLGLGMSARAQEGSTVSVAVPFEFVAGSKAMPAGTYNVSRTFPMANQSLTIRSHGDGVSLLPIYFDETAGQNTKLTFQQIGEQYFLSKIETPAGVYAIAAPRAITRLAQVKVNGTLSASGIN